MENIPSSGEQPKDIRLEKPTFIDPLTLLFNQYYLAQFLPEEIKKARLSSYSLAVVMIDVDHFKGVNDTYGHLAGDEVLKQFSAILKKTVRTTDAVIRYAGDEFILLLPGAGMQQVQKLCARLISDVGAHAFTLGKKDKTIQMTTSIGFSLYPDDGTEPAAIIDQADKALYCSKQRGRNRVAYAKEVVPEEMSVAAALSAFPCATLINQKEALQQLHQMFNEAEGSRVLKVALVRGPSGVGKTRMTREVAYALQGRAIIIQCKADPVHRQDPYCLLARGIGDYVDKARGRNIQLENLFFGIPAAELGELSLLVPSLQAMAQVAPAAQGGGLKKRALLFQALRDVFMGFERMLPVVIICDDAHLADAASLKLLSDLVTKAKERRILMVCTCPDQVSPDEAQDGAMEEFLAEAGRNGAVFEIMLHNLSREDSLRMVQAILPDIKGPAAFGQWVYEASGGNPAFIEESLKSLLENKAIFYRATGWEARQDLARADIPSTFKDIMFDRIKKLDPETKEMILQAAVMGDNFRIDLLQQLGDKNEGMIAELIERTRKMKLVDTSEDGEKFSFLNKETQRILYQELSREQRDALHYQVAQALARQQQGVSSVGAGELAYHYGQSSLQERAPELSRQFLDKARELYSPDEVNKYLEMLTQDLIDEQEDAIAELTESKKKEAILFIRSLLGAVKKVRFYPPSSLTRIEATRELKRVLDGLFAELEALNLAESEKSLVINGKRITPKEAEEADADQIVFMLMQHNIKAITFKQGTGEDELRSMIELLSQAPHAIIEQGGWKALVRQRGIQHIRMDEVLFTPVGKTSSATLQKKKLENIMLMEFLMGKVEHPALNKEEISSFIQDNPAQIARALEEYSDKVAQDGGTKDQAQAISGALDKLRSEIAPSGALEHKDPAQLVKVLLELKQGIRNEVIRSKFTEADPRGKQAMGSMFAELDEDVIANLNVESYNENNHDLLTLREMLESLGVDEEKKKRIMEKIEAQLAARGVSKREIDFILGRADWSSLPLETRMRNILALPKGRYVAESSRIKDVLTELARDPSKEPLKGFLSKLFEAMGSQEAGDAKALLGVITEAANDHEAGHDTTPMRRQTLEFLRGRLQAENDIAHVTHLLNLAGQLMQPFIARMAAAKDVVQEMRDPAASGEFSAIIDILLTLDQRVRSQSDRGSVLCKLIDSFFAKTCQPRFLEVLVHGIAGNDRIRRTYDLRQLSFIPQDTFIDTVISLATRKSDGIRDLYSEYVNKKIMVGLLSELKAAAAQRMIQLLPGIQEDSACEMLELAGLLREEALIEYVAPFSYHANASVRKVAVLALAEIGGHAGAEALKGIARDARDKDIRNLAKAQLQQVKGE